MFGVSYVPGHPLIRVRMGHRENNVSQVFPNVAASGEFIKADVNTDNKH
jgi:hypothetical protein